MMDIEKRIYLIIFGITICGFSGLFILVTGIDNIFVSREIKVPVTLLVLFFLSLVITLWAWRSTPTEEEKEKAIKQYREIKDEMDTDTNIRFKGFIPYNAIFTFIALSGIVYIPAITKGSICIPLDGGFPCYPIRDNPLLILIAVAAFAPLIPYIVKKYRERQKKQPL